MAGWVHASPPALWVVVGVGSDVPQNPQPARFRQKHNIRGPFAVYVGRIDQNKGCPELFEFFQGYVLSRPQVLSALSLSTSRLRRVSLLGALTGENVDIEQVVTIVTGMS